jgi:heptosyltransferase I
MKPLPAKARFLICRLSAVGDTVHTLPLAQVIKRQWPDAFVAWAVEKGAAPLVQTCADVDEAIVVPKGFLKSPSQLVQLRRKLRAMKFDVALDPQSLTKSSVLAWLSGAKRRIGFTRPIGRELAPWLDKELVKPQQRHVVRRYLEVLRPLGVETTDCDVAWNLPRNPASEATIDKLLQTAGLIDDFAVINPGAGWDSKVWPAERYAEVARQLPVRSVIGWAGEKERAWADEIVASSNSRALLAPPTSLLELTALVRRAGLFIGSDTGPLHIAAAAGTPCVALYGPTRPEVCGPFGTGHTVLYYPAVDQKRPRKLREGNGDAMLQISVQQVVSAAEGLLRLQKTARAA